MHAPIRKSIPALALTLAAAALAACGGSSASSTAPGTPPTYRVRVAVTGLAGSGLALHSSLGDDLPVPSSGTFSFATAAAAGTAYTVTLTAQPASPWQTCAFTGSASGHVGEADAAVQVACTTNRYPVSAHVSGLAGGGLSLHLGADTVDPVADGTVTFATSVASGDAYTVGVAQQPASPWQTCGVTGNGTVADRAVIVEVGCTTNRYRVVVSASGILLGGLTLQDNGGDTLAVDADGVRTFATSVASGDPYAVTTATLPPTQSCTVTSGAGTVANADVAVTVACGCASGLADCNHVATDGCEAPLDSTSNCGTCGHSCGYQNALAQCSGGQCQLVSCQAGFLDCDAFPTNGCEVNRSTDPNNCNGCSIVCSYAHGQGVCAPGGCSLGTCDPGWANCDRNDANGCETNVGGGVCPPSCTNNVKDGNETDVDCGGSCTQKCADGRTCIVNADCRSGACSGAHTCAATQQVHVVRVGDGTTALSAAAAPVVLERVSTADGSLGVPVLLPLSQAGANQPLTLAGNATSEGALTLSGDGRYVTLAGYAAVPTTAGVATTSVPRVAARVDAYGTVDTSTSTASSFGGVATVRAAASADGTGFWMSGSSGGLAYLPFGMTVGAVTVLSTPANLRVCGISGGQLYCDSASLSFQAPFKVGTGEPTTAGQTATVDPGLDTTLGASRYGFALLDRSAGVAGVDTLYVADDRAPASGGGLQKWTWDGATWTLVATYTNGLTTGLRGLAAFVRGSVVVVVATTTETSANRLVLVVDDGVSGNPAFQTLATAAANTVYRGVALVPAP